MFVTSFQFLHNRKKAKRCEGPEFLKDFFLSRSGSVLKSELRGNVLLHLFPLEDAMHSHWWPGKPRWTPAPPALSTPSHPQLLQNLDTDLIILHGRRTSVDLIILQEQNRGRRTWNWQKCQITCRAVEQQRANKNMESSFEKIEFQECNLYSIRSLDEM